jgi:hypothetical protein
MYRTKEMKDKKQLPPKLHFPPNNPVSKLQNQESSSRTFLVSLLPLPVDIHSRDVYTSHPFVMPMVMLELHDNDDCRNNPEHEKNGCDDAANQRLAFSMPLLLRMLGDITASRLLKVNDVCIRRLERARAWQVGELSLVVSLPQSVRWLCWGSLGMVWVLCGPGI